MLAILQFHSNFIAFLVFLTAFHHSSELFGSMFCFALADLTSPSSECQKQKSPAPIPAFAGTERRARFSYDDLLELFSFAEPMKNDLSPHFSSSPTSSPSIS
jgi:hypothetical protein